MMVLFGDRKIFKYDRAYSMNIYVLVDNRTGGKLGAEWGLSFYIEFNGKNILFDFGASDLYIENGKRQGIDVFDADYYVLSHGHSDHGNGLKFMSRGRLICHPEAFIKRYIANSKDKTHIGLPYSLKEAKEKFDIIMADKPYEIDDDIIFLGQIPRVTDFESKSTEFIKEDGTWDFVEDDSGLVFKMDKGLVIISGCAHSGICNIIKYAKKVTGINKVYAVIGGFHLKGNDEITNKTIEYLKTMNIEYLSTSHCTQFPALVQFANILDSMPFKVGDIIEL